MVSTPSILTGIIGAIVAAALLGMTLDNTATGVISGIGVGIALAIALELELRSRDSRSPR